MGRHHVKLPDHLYLSSPPPSPQPAPKSKLTSASSFFTSKSGLSYDSASSLFHSTTTKQAFGSRIPGFKTSATFLRALRANIDLQVENPDSAASTPDCLRPVPFSTSKSILPSPSPVVHAMSTLDADLAPPAVLDLPKASVTEAENPDSQVNKDPNAIPELVTYAASDDTSRIEALRLVADSVAQQRQRASRALVFHPITVGLLAISLGLVHKYFYTGTASDYSIIGTTFAGIIMTALVTIRSATGGYIDEAERVGTWRWLAQGRSKDTELETGKRILGEKDDEILVTKFGDEYIGTIIFRGVQSSDASSASTKKTSKKSDPATQPRTEIRAWTVRQKYRGKGVGTALLEDAIKTARERGWAQGGIEVASDHANSKVILPSIFSGFVQSNGERSRRFVEKKFRELESNDSSGKGKKRR